MTHGKHETSRKPSDPHYVEEWSGISYSPHCDFGCVCGVCKKEKLHVEDGSHYCPYCDNFSEPKKNCPNS